MALQSLLLVGMLAGYLVGKRKGRPGLGVVASVPISIGIYVLIFAAMGFVAAR